MKKTTLFLGATILSSCSSYMHDYKDSTTNITNLQSGDLDKTQKELSETGILYSLNSSSINRMAQKYSQSNNNLTDIDQWVNYTRPAYFNNNVEGINDILQTDEKMYFYSPTDEEKDYAIKDYEKIMLRTYKAMNYLDLNDLNNAKQAIQEMYQTEDYIANIHSNPGYNNFAQARKLTDKFPSYEAVVGSSQYGYDFFTINTPQVYQLPNDYQNGFSQYLAGFIFEASGNYADARDSYHKAQLLSKETNLTNTSINNLDKHNYPSNNETDLLLVEELGHAPQTKARTIKVKYNPGQNLLCNVKYNIQLPELRMNNLNNSEVATIQINNSNHAIDPILFTDIETLAARDLHDNLPRIYNKMMTPVAVYAMQQYEICLYEAVGDPLEILTGTSNVGTVDLRFAAPADERSWSLLPGKLYIQRVRLNRGTNTITIATSTGSKTIQLNLDKAYQMLSFRVIGNQIYINTTKN